MKMYWLVVTIPLALICLAIAIAMVQQLLKQHRTGDLVSVPLVAEQELDIDGSGAMLLHGEGPRLTTAFAKLDYHLVDLADGNVVPLSNILLKSSASGVSRSRLSLRYFTVDRPGRYRLVVLGLDGLSLSEPHNIVFTHDTRRKLVVNIVSLVFSAIGFFAGLGMSVFVYLINQ